MTDFDAIVVGSGMSGGWSAKELAERGLKVLVLERGPNVDPTTDYADMLNPWERPNFDLIPQAEVSAHYPIQHRGVAYAVKQTNKHFWVRDSEHPYTTEAGTDYDWLRGYHLGGRSITWGRQSYRMSDLDFEANNRDGHGIEGHPPVGPGLLDGGGDRVVGPGLVQVSLRTVVAEERIEQDPGAAPRVAVDHPQTPVPRLLQELGGASRQQPGMLGAHCDPLPRCKRTPETNSLTPAASRSVP